MGLSWSKRLHRNHNHRQQEQPLPPPPFSSNPPSPITFPPPPPPQQQQQPQPPPPPQQQTRPPPLPPPQSQSPPTSVTPPAQPPSYAFAANAPYSTSPSPPEQHPYPPQPPCPPRPAPFPPPSLPSYNYSYTFSNYYSRPVNTMGQYSNYRPYYAPQISGWGPPAAPPPQPPPPLQPAPYVDHQSAKKIKNDVNVHKDTIKLQLDELNQDCHLVTFTFDALVDGSITIFYFAKEGDHCRFAPVYPDIVPVKIPFQKGLGQKFCQPSGTGVDLGFFDTDDLSKPVPGEDIYPLVISAESCYSSEELLNASHAQISQAVLEKKRWWKFSSESNKADSLD